ncbi:hypothetical protein MUP65_03035, partial [Patescibacteria group bacterium]|nr:hypothetical protein [Patescibacteria group bacterium]
MLDIVQRYQPIVRLIKKHPPESKKILEVGGGGDGLGYYLPRFQIIDCDIQHSPTIPANTKPIIIKNEKLPFANNYSHTTVSIDTLEHIQDKRRRLAMIKELVRVTDKYLYLAVPTGEKSLEAHQKLKKHLLRFHPKKESHYLDEHLSFGHPEKEEILELLQMVAPKAKINTKQNGNIRLWLAFQKTYLALTRLYHLLKYRNFWRKLIGPVWSLTNRPPAIRTLFICNLKPAEEEY